MRVTQDFLGELLRPAAAAPKQPTSRERAAANRLAVLRTVAAHGHLQASPGLRGVERVRHPCNLIR